jgi:hypothetical protein
MASLTHAYTDTHTDNLPATSRTRTGGPRRYLRPDNTYERYERLSNGRLGSHMPIDTSIHWEWRNPLNILPAIVLMFLAIAVIGMVLA